MKITIQFCALESVSRTLNIEKNYNLVAELSAEQYILEDMFRAFNHGIPGKTGELAEHYKTRSLSVGDKVSFGGKTWKCGMVGWEIE